MMTIAVDLAKSVFEVVVADRGNRITERKRLTRRQFECWIETRTASHFVLEACATANFWGRQLQGLGHRVSVLPGQYVKAYRRGNKTDRRDAVALLEASRAPDLQPVTIKTPKQQSLQQLHRLREQWVSTRTARINAARAILREYGIVLPAGANAVRRRVPAIIEDAEQGLPDAMRAMLFQLIEEIEALDSRISEAEHQLQAYGNGDDTVQRLAGIPGLGLLTTTAVVAAVGDLRQFRNGRQFAGWLGVTPREHSSGRRRQLGAITKKGNVYLRKLFIHGARSVLASAERKARGGSELTPLEAWATRTRARVGFNKAAVGLANKLARRVFAICRDEADYDAAYQLGAV